MKAVDVNSLDYAELRANWCLKLAAWLDKTSIDWEVMISCNLGESIFKARQKNRRKRRDTKGIFCSVQLLLCKIIECHQSLLFSPGLPLSPTLSITHTHTHTAHIQSAPLLHHVLLLLQSDHTHTHTHTQRGRDWVSERCVFVQPLSASLHRVFCRLAVGGDSVTSTTWRYLWCESPRHCVHTTSRPPKHWYLLSAH